MFEARAAVVAVVEDDADMRQAMRRVLETEGYVAKVFDSAEAFLATDAAVHARCVVIDVHLPGMSGTELQRHLRHMGRPVPTVCVTGKPTKDTASCLIKPFPAEDLIRAVGRSIRRGEAR